MLKFNKDDTIVALATAPGTGAIAVIRLSGPLAFSIGDRIFQTGRKKSKRLSEFKSHTVHYGTILEGDEVLDEVVVSIFRNPASYTGQDTVEIACHGSPYIQQRVLKLLTEQGARMAEPGEFTLRAFLNGKLDLSQAEAVADLIASDTSAAHQVSIQQLRGGFSGEIKKFRHDLIQFASLIELELDFSEEDVEFASRSQLKDSIEKMRIKLKSLIDSFDLGNVIRHGIPVVIAGKPNAGKSTLLNALLNEERAIVSPVAGTTRDTIEEEVTIGGIRFRFIDTAGIRETSDTIERIGVDRTMEKIRQSPVIVYLFDVNETSSCELEEEMESLRKEIDPSFIIHPVGNKIDQYNVDQLQHEYRSIKNLLLISAREKTNIDQLKDALVGHIHSGALRPGDVIVSNARHADSLRKTEEALHKVTIGLENKVTSDFIAGDLRYALHHLGEITGEISTDDILENIFSKFCIGK